MTNGRMINWNGPGRMCLWPVIGHFPKICFWLKENPGWEHYLSLNDSQQDIVNNS
jgi:hypothetical protein